MANPSRSDRSENYRVVHKKLASNFTHKFIKYSPIFKLLPVAKPLVNFKTLIIDDPATFLNSNTVLEYWKLFHKVV